MIKIKLQTALGLVLMSLLFGACRPATNPQGETNNDTATAGEIDIAVDETYKPIMEAEIAAFEAIYTHAKINVHYLPEAEAYQKLLNKEVRLVIGSRGLNNEEIKVFEEWRITPKEVKLATDAIALITHRENSIARMDQETLKGVLNGSIKNWADVPGAEEMEGIVSLVFDHGKSSTVRYLRDVLLSGDSLTSDAFSAKGNEKVIDYVSENKLAIGVIGVNWISDRDENSTREFLEKVNVLELPAPEGGTDPGEYFQPYQGYIAQKNYPLIRPVYSVSREARMGLGTGFVSFVAGEKGQRVFLKAGLLPEYIPVRIVEFPPVENATDIDKYRYEKRNNNE